MFAGKDEVKHFNDGLWAFFVTLYVYAKAHWSNQYTIFWFLILTCQLLSYGGMGNSVNSSILDFKWSVTYCSILLNQFCLFHPCPSCAREPRTPGEAFPGLSRRITSLDMLSVLFLMQLRIPSAFFATSAPC